MFTSRKQELLSVRSPQLKLDYPAWQAFEREGEGNFDARIFVYSREKLFIFLAFPKSLSSSLSSTYHAGLSSQSLHTWLPCGAESNHTMAQQFLVFNEHMIVAVVIAIKPEKNSGLQLVLRDAKYKNTGSFLVLLITGADYFWFLQMITTYFLIWTISISVGLILAQSIDNNKYCIGKEAYYKTHVQSL